MKQFLNPTRNGAFIFAVVILVLLYFISNSLSSFKSSEKPRYLFPDPEKVKIPFLVYRTDLGLVMEKLKGERMIEIGVQSGNFAVSVLNNWPSFKMYYGIDSWRPQDNYKDESNVDVKTHEENYKLAEQRLKQFDKRVKLIRDYSKNAIKEFSDYSIDFIYLDGRKDYCSATEDLELYFPKLKCGGVMAGNEFYTVEEQYRIVLGDYSICPNGERVLTNGGGVKGAVLDFTKRYYIYDLKVTNESLPTFYFVKPCPKKID